MPTQLAKIHALLTRRDPAAARLITVSELEAIRRQAREQMPKATGDLIQDLVLVKAMEVLAERTLGDADRNRKV
jgi:hypothetical protein